MNALTAGEPVTLAGRQLWYQIECVPSLVGAPDYASIQQWMRENGLWNDWREYLED